MYACAKQCRKDSVDEVGFREAEVAEGRRKQKDSARLVNFKWHVNFLTLSWHFMSTMQPLLSATPKPLTPPHPHPHSHLPLATQPISLAVCVTCGKRCLAKCHHYVNYKCNRLRLGSKQGAWQDKKDTKHMRPCGSYTSVSGAKTEMLKRCVLCQLRPFFNSQTLSFILPMCAIIWAVI